MAGHIAPASEVAGGLFKKAMAWSANFKMVRYVLLRPELDGQDQVQIIVTPALNCRH
jgi:hypothetical protein